MKRALAFGLSGQVGDALRPLLAAAGWQVIAVTRQLPATLAAAPGLEWRNGELAVPPELPAEVDALLSLGPLDAFGVWYEASDIRAARIIVLGSTSLRFKAQSPDAAERDLAGRLALAEQRLFAATAARGSLLTVLRPTLIYGNGRDRSLTPLMAWARRWGLCPLPRGARGLRQPVHVEDLAAAVMACLDQPRTGGQAYDLPGGETLSFEAMVRRCLDAHAPRARLLRLPGPVFRWLWALRPRRRWAGLGGAGLLGRLGQDQVADPGPAQRDFGYRARPFRP